MFEFFSWILVPALAGVLVGMLLIWAHESFLVKHKKEEVSSLTVSSGREDVPVQPKSVNAECDPYLIAYAREKYGPGRFCGRCGGLLEEHDIYGTVLHVPGLDKVEDDYSISTADCPGFLTADGETRKNPIWQECGLECPIQVMSTLNQELARDARNQP
ncbi:MAG: hypothetical protein A2408_00130 [Candidatus Yonathbacteria bacterium RIFOXYC1_FULL_52_10]|uniref:Uncharacterized protein n=1 Tax=Candidatus Yonathbacteria bacterium RIFOXYD1_FULL_52_36 TaxID=1802730 RepID=A0A1G2SKC8_9BACT|nr:MAG: hypothetical protein A2408_00130 [Candidatus Yonathbacteria bacterium RIFOXYC1_FULL_52_10]OHA85490.1 MAG: hypothetical protein A2591_01380 [Candidatus Yonathbacteria bacterium RIFOXYD1_FULL_52_36]